MTLSNFGHCPVRERGPTATDAENNGSATFRRTSVGQMQFGQNNQTKLVFLAKSVWDFRVIFETLHFFVTYELAL